ncbi:type II toxin-antitoxin system RelE/ParE family toxin [Ensifer adhaerens]|uniref:type II toxin-antitoxin system RelE/ParE family toxin n=1 Tax=Ensifer adhaerens TaxID=106592 RepID=UPI001FEEC766|nr:type II toxin-antitoxin system RelE/ParE family toxin [Ensifer adhaerens]
MAFRLSVAAEEDIIAIAADGVRLFGSAQARRYHDELFAVFALIAANHFKQGTAPSGAVPCCFSVARQLPAAGVRRSFA